MKPRITIERALHDRNLLGAALGDLASWSTWLAVVKAAYGMPLDPDERAAFALVAGDRDPPGRKVRELVVVASRRSGKGRMAAALAVFEAALVKRKLAPGEKGVVATISPTRAQARIVQDYARGYLEASPVLRGEIANVTNDEIELRNGSTIVTLTTDYRTMRGRTLLLAVLDEASFLRSEETSTPDIEAARALLPGLATTSGMLVILSSPYRRSGLLFERFRDYFGKDDPGVLVVSGASTVFNPLLDLGMIEAARVSDPQAAASEWDGLFRNDLSAFLDDALIDAAIDHGRPMELPPREKTQYFAFVDASAGRHDAFTVAVCHREGEKIIADVVRGRRPPFDPASVAREFAALAKEYRAGNVTGDNYAPGWVSGAFRDAGCSYTTSPKTRSELYLESLPLWTRGCISIPNHQQLTRELRQLERRTARSGKDSVDHGPSGSDDFANALAGAAWLARAEEKFTAPPAEFLIARGGQPFWGDVGYGGGSIAPGISNGAEYSGNGGAGFNRRGGW